MTSTKPMKREIPVYIVTRWCVDSYGWVWIMPGIELSPEEMEEITRQVHECRPGKPN